MSSPILSIVVPNWNGESLLPRCVAGAIQSAQASGLAWEMIVVDDASSDRGVELLRAQHPSVKVFVNPLNRGFGPTANRGAAEAQGEFLILLNNDLVPKEPMISELVEPLQADAGLFGVSGKTINWSDQQPNHLNMIGQWRDHEITPVHTDPDEPAPTTFLQGGSCAMRRAEFLRLGGFCHLFSPGYWEDYDLSYLALKAGWRNLYNPRAAAYHLGQASMRRALGPDYIEALKARNGYFFQWLNLTDPAFVQELCMAVPASVARGLARPGEPRNRLRGLMRGMRFLREVRVERERRKQFIKRTDAEVLAPFAGAAGGPNL